MDFKNKVEKTRSGKVYLIQRLSPLEIKLLQAGLKLSELYTDLKTWKDALTLCYEIGNSFNDSFYKQANIDARKTGIPKFRKKYDTIMKEVNQSYKQGCEIIAQDSKVAERHEQEKGEKSIFIYDKNDVQTCADNFKNTYFQTAEIAKACASILTDEQYIEGDEQ